MFNKSYNGSAIVIAVLAISAIMTIGLGVAQLVPRDYRATLSLESSANAEQAAWAGIEHGLLLLRNNPYYELSDDLQPGAIATNANRPYGEYKPLTADQNCDQFRNLAICQALDRQLGIPRRQIPYVFHNGPQLNEKSPIGDSAAYGVVIWHRRHNVGNITPNGLDDGLRPEINNVINSANINPTLTRDEVKHLDVRQTAGGLKIHWKPVMDRDGCHIDDSKSEIGLLATIFDSDDKIQGRQYDAAKAGQFGERLINLNLPADAYSMTLRLVVKPDGGDTDGDVRDCFARYALENKAPNETADLGFDVIDAVGSSGRVRRKIRVIVDRENNRLLNIFDFGIACDECKNVN